MKIYKCLIAVFVLAVCTVLPVVVLGAEEPVKIRIATSADFPPYESIDSATARIVGFDIDLMNAIAEKGGFEVEYINVDFDGIFLGLDRDQYDAVISAVTITEERKKSYDFSEPYITVAVENSGFNPDNIEDYGIVVKKGNKTVLDLINNGLREVINENLVEGLKIKWEIK